MLRKSALLLSTGVALFFGGIHLGCANSQKESCCQEPTTQSTAASGSTTQPAGNSATTANDPFHIAKPTAPVEGVPTPQETPSPEAIVANKKVCPDCGTPNASNAAICIKCGHKFN